MVVGPLVTGLDSLCAMVFHTFSQPSARQATLVVSFPPERDPARWLPLLPCCSDEEAEALGSSTTCSRSPPRKERSWDLNPGHPTPERVRLTTPLWYNLDLDTGFTRQRVTLEEERSQRLVRNSDDGAGVGGGGGGDSGKPPGWWGGCRSRPRGLRWDGEVRALTAGHHLPLQVVPGQVQHPEDRVVQEDQEQRDEELPEKVGDGQEVKQLLPPGQVEGACGGAGWSGRLPGPSPSRLQTRRGLSPGGASCPAWGWSLSAHLAGVVAARTPGQSGEPSSRSGLQSWSGGLGLHLGLEARLPSPGAPLPGEPLIPKLNSLLHRQPPRCISSTFPHSHFLPTPEAFPPSLFLLHIRSPLSFSLS